MISFTSMKFINIVRKDDMVLNEKSSTSTRVNIIWLSVEEQQSRMCMTYGKKTIKIDFILYTSIKKDC